MSLPDLGFVWSPMVKIESNFVIYKIAKVYPKSRTWDLELLVRPKNCNPSHRWDLWPKTWKPGPLLDVGSKTHDSEIRTTDPRPKALVISGTWDPRPLSGLN